MKMTYMQPQVLVHQLMPGTALLTVSTMTVSSESFDEASMTSLTREQGSFDFSWEDDYEE